MTKCTSFMWLSKPSFVIVDKVTPAWPEVLFVFHKLCSIKHMSNQNYKHAIKELCWPLFAASLGEFPGCYLVFQRFHLIEEWDLDGEVTDWWLSFHYHWDRIALMCLWLLNAEKAAIKEHYYQCTMVEIGVTCTIFIFLHSFSAYWSRVIFSTISSCHKGIFTFTITMYLWQLKLYLFIWSYPNSPKWASFLAEHPLMFTNNM